MIYVILFPILMMFDVVTTLMAFKVGGGFVEVNPFMRVILNHSIIYFY